MNATSCRLCGDPIAVGADVWRYCQGQAEHDVCHAEECSPHLGSEPMARTPAGTAGEGNAHRREIGRFYPGRPHLGSDPWGADRPRTAGEVARGRFGCIRRWPS